MNVKVFIIALFVVLLSGCITIEVHEKISASGESDVTVQYDMRALLEMMRGFSEDDARDSFCENFSTEDSGLTNAVCSDDDGLITIMGKVRHGPEEFSMQTSLKGKVYTYNVSMGMAFIDELGEDDAQGGFQGNSYMKSVGVSLTYKVDMPARIKSSTHGTISGSTVTLDLLEISPQEEIIIVAEKSSIGVLIIAGTALLAIILLAAAIIYNKKGKIKNAP